MFHPNGMAMKEKDKLQWIYSSRDNQELENRYDEWADTYDLDLEHDYGWRVPKLTAVFLDKYVPKNGRILDAGAGTGLVGECLQAKGYRNLVAIDLSQKMLEKARSKKVYRELYQMVLGDNLDFPTDHFDAVVSVGVLTYGHAPPSSFDELLRVTKSNGHIVFSIRIDVYESKGFKEKQDLLEQEGKWKLVEVSESMQAFSDKERDVYQRVWVYKVMQ
jgi:predicted TPR repeat methyltransferase